MTNKELSNIFEDLKQLKIMANNLANKKTISQPKIKAAISIYEEEYNLYRHLLSQDHSTSGELSDLKMIISKLKNRLE